MISLLTIILQVALEAFTKNPNLAGGGLCGYFPQDTTVSEAPKGYKPFYISHIARHGSRFHSKGSSSCFQVADTLAYYAEKGMLTDDGLALLDDIRMLHAMSEGRYGDLTALGAQEHRDICARMVRHYPEVFTDPSRTKVVAYSTDSPRVQESMQAFDGELKERAPGLTVTQTVSHWKKDLPSQEVNGYHMSKEEREAAKQTEKSYDKTTSALRKGYDFKVFASRIFRDPAAVSAKTVRRIAVDAMKALKTSCVTDPDKMPGMGKYFTPGELYYFWLGGSMSWVRYLDAPGYVNPFTASRGRGIIECFLRDADEAMTAGSPVAATLRFSHDTYLLPVMAAIPLEGTVITCDEMDIADFFQDYNFICPACNVQLVFYRRGKKDPVLVKFLLNEKETLIHGLNPATGCFYDWSKVKRFWQQTAK